MSKGRRIRVTMVQIVNRNLGDSVIADCTEYLIKKVLKRHRRKYILFPYNIYSEDYEFIKRSDAVIFVGGGIIKYKYEKFYEYISEILYVTEKYEIPVFFNAVGVEGFDINDEKCMQLKKALNYDCVKAITVRNELETLKEKYITNSNIILKEVYDSAIWCPKVYRIKKKRSEVIGLGIVRWRIFRDNGIEYINKEDLLKFWSEIISFLNSEGIRWKVFTNGLKSDEEFAEEVLRYAGYEDVDKYKIDRPAEASELVETIAGFKAIIASRLHANIIAYALGIPSVAPVWNEKLVSWGRLIKFPERFILAEKLSSANVIFALQNALKEKVPRISYVNKHEVLWELKKFIQNCVKKKLSGTETAEINWKNKLVATALGGLNYQYCNMNCLMGLKQAVYQGFLWLETDVRLTEDNRLVCVNGWNSAINEKLGLMQDRISQQPMHYEEFMKQKYYGRYKVCDFSMIMNGIRGRKKLNVILDIGKPKKELVELFLKRLLKEIPTRLLENVYLRLQRKNDVQIARKMKRFFNIMYYLEKEEDIGNIIDFCHQQNIKWVTMRADVVSVKICNELHANSLKTCVFSAKTYQEIKKIYECGGDLIASHYISPNMLLDMGM